MNRSMRAGSSNAPSSERRRTVRVTARYIAAKYPARSPVAEHCSTIRSSALAVDSYVFVVTSDSVSPR